MCFSCVKRHNTPAQASCLPFFFLIFLLFNAIHTQTHTHTHTHSLRVRLPHNQLSLSRTSISSFFLFFSRQHKLRPSDSPVIFTRLKRQSTSAAQSRSRSSAVAQPPSLQSANGPWSPLFRLAPSPPPRTRHLKSVHLPGLK